ncbi:hypothetical protein LRP49_20820 [Enterovibrio sp. ZSDZ35]|uniref:Uncharacterized protein n=1 Tax=Enterovibrio qingdaonensis TaxID=2899818 RepID=A0ABT5QRL3_9GAMM|nr:hypothetical protein [Enterovibrio sp. ZSDZ35]MDD1783622.1 hypothetical protein [Enterovibrio sp. ZSDZ35]
MKKSALVSVVVSAVFAQQSFAACLGNVFSLNAGRGDVGILVDVQESNKLTGAYNGSRALAVSRAEFSASAMTYDSINNRIYYVSTPRPKTYHVQGLENFVSDDEFNNLSFHAATLEPIQLAYYDPDSKTHTVVGTVPAVFRMAFNASTGQIIASDNMKIFSIDPASGTTATIADFDTGLISGGFTSWGDFVYYNNELLFVSNTRTFIINESTGAASIKAFHYIDFVTGATLDQNGQMLVAAKNQNVTGNINSTWLWRLNPATGEKASVGLIPARLSALATNTQEDYTCYPETVFPSEKVNDVGSITTANVEEGETATFTVNFDKDTAAPIDINLQLNNGTAVINSDFSGSVSVEFEDGSSTTASLSSTSNKVNVPAGNGWMKVKVNTVEDSIFESNETFSLKAWFRDDESDAKSATVTINNDDYQVMQLLGNPEMNYRGVWGEIENGLNAKNLNHSNGSYNFNWAGQGQGAAVYQYFNVVPEQQYSVQTRFWAQSSGTGGNHGGEVRITNGYNNSTIASQGFTLYEGNSTNINFNFTAPANVNYLRIQITNTSVSCCVESTDLNVDYARVTGPKPQ